MNTTIDSDDLRDIEHAAEELIASVHAIREVAATHPHLVDSLLASVEYALAAQSACLHQLRVKAT
jgi:hypothetical protein